MIRLVLFTFMLLFAAPLRASGCAATPEAAVHNAIGASSQAAANAGASGYRVQDVHVDAVMRKVWVRVMRCDDPSQPPVLVPLNITLAQNLPLPTLAQRDGSQATAFLAQAAPVAVHAGDAVKVFFASQSVQMEVEGTADSQAALGDAMNVTLKRMGDEPPHRIHGVLRADHRVEVQP